MAIETLVLIWFAILGVLLTGYAILDGFDFGVGILHPFVARTDKERRLVMNSIGPLWDGNEVWLVTFGGALFAMFPEAYAAIFSGFYTAFMVLLFALIFRAVSLEFRSKMKSPTLRSVWDWAFCGASLTAPLMFGVAAGNTMLGLPLDARGNVMAGVLDQLGLYPLLVGAMTVAVFAMHGAIFLYLKTEGELQARLVPAMWSTFGVFLVLFMFTTMFTLQAVERATLNFERAPVLWVIPVLLVLAVANVPRAIILKRPGLAFVSSSCIIAALVALFGAALFPNMVTASNDPALSLTLQRSASSASTLKLGLVIVAIGVPFISTYTAIIYWTFRGKVQLGPNSY